MKNKKHEFEIDVFRFGQVDIDLLNFCGYCSADAVRTTSPISIPVPVPSDQPTGIKIPSIKTPVPIKEISLPKDVGTGTYVPAPTDEPIGTKISVPTDTTIIKKIPLPQDKDFTTKTLLPSEIDETNPLLTKTTTTTTEVPKVEVTVTPTIAAPAYPYPQNIGEGSGGGMGGGIMDAGEEEATEEEQENGKFVDETKILGMKKSTAKKVFILIVLFGIGYFIYKNA